MKTISYIAIFLALAGCNPDGIGCFKSSGQLETIYVNVPDFNTISVNSNIEIRLSPGATKEVNLTAGSNLIPGIQVEVIDGILYLNNLNTCNWSRKYVNPVVHITNPLLTKIVQQGFGKIIGEGKLTYNELTLENNLGSGDFIFDINTSNLTITSNEVANFYLTGSAEQMTIGFQHSDGIFYGEEFSVKNCTVTHNGSNSMHLNVIDSLKGGILSLGDVFLYRQKPLSIEVTESSSGKLIFVP